MKVRSWRSELDAVIEASRRKPFEWGTHDCALFAADCVLAMTGEDIGAKFRGQYSSAKGAAKALRKLRFKHHVDVAAAAFEAIPVARARVGDLAVISEAGIEALGVVIGPTVAVVTPAGLGVVPLHRATRCFRVE